MNSHKRKNIQIHLFFFPSTMTLYQQKGKQRQPAVKKFHILLNPISILLFSCIHRINAEVYTGRTCSFNEDGICDENYVSDNLRDRKLMVYELIHNSWGYPQKLYDNHHHENTKVLLEQMETYMATTTLNEEQSSFCQLWNENCAYWAAQGDCVTNHIFMFSDCGPVCQTCHEVNININTGETGATASSSPREKSGTVNKKIRVTTSTPSVSVEEVIDIVWGGPQKITKKYAKYAKKIRSVIDEMNDYMTNQVSVREEFASVSENCRTRHEMCAAWTAEGECEANSSWMKVNCAPTCKSCELLDYSVRCPIDDNLPTAWGPGDLDRLFERITTDPYYKQYSPSILSSPDTTGGPWVIQLDNFTTSEERDLLIDYGHSAGYADSITVGKQKFDGTVEKVTSKVRTSKTAWCEKECLDDPMVQSLQRRIEDITGIPQTNSEHLQLLRYQQSQYYRKHHDFLAHHVKQPQGPRILTFYMYLNNVGSGGGTHFPNLDMTVWPKRGRAVLWPSVLNEDPWTQDPRTEHEALVVEDGIKFGANAWIHQRDYKTPHNAGCT